MREPNPVIAIEYYAARNESRRAGDWLPIIINNGHAAGSTWAGRGYDEDEALAAARTLAEEEAARYVGDWDVSIREIEPPKPKE